MLTNPYWRRSGEIFLGKFFIQHCIRRPKGPNMQNKFHVSSPPDLDTRDRNHRIIIRLTMRVSEVTLPLGRGGPFVRAPHSEVAKEGHHQEAAVVREEAGMSLLTPVMVQKPKLTEVPVNVTSLILTLPGLTNIQPELQMLKLEQLPQPDKLGGRLRLFAPNWRKISNDPEIIRIVQGYQISFNTIPDQRRPMTSPKFSQRERDLIDLEVAEMLKKGAISKAGYLKNQFVGHVFLREKKNNKFRLVFNLKPLNVHIKYEHFKMESMIQLTSIIQANDWMVSIDLKDAYPYTHTITSISDLYGGKLCINS